jgi:subtilisin family serine protease
MKNRFAVVSLTVAFVACILNFTSYVFAESSDEETNKRLRELIEKSQKEKEKQHPKIDYNLTDVEDAYKKNGLEAAIKIAKERHLDIKNNKIRVHIVLQPGISAEDFDATLLESYGVVVDTRAGDILLADIPFDKLKEIADKVEGILYIRPPNKPHALTYQSEAVSQNLTGTRSYISSGLTGSGVKVAVIDGGFKGVSSAISNGELPSVVLV